MLSILRRALSDWLTNGWWDWLEFWDENRVIWGEVAETNGLVSYWAEAVALLELRRLLGMKEMLKWDGRSFETVFEHEVVEMLGIIEIISGEETWLMGSIWGESAVGSVSTDSWIGTSFVGVVAWWACHLEGSRIFLTIIIRKFVYNIPID
jgi:hypothetical protein